MRLSVICSVSLIVLVATAPAFAGFEFVAPTSAPSAAAPSGSNDQAPAIVTPAVPAAPVAIQNEALPEPVAAPERVMNERSTTPIAPVQVPLTPVINDGDTDALAIESGSYNHRPSMPAPMRNVVDNLAPPANTSSPSTIGNDGSNVEGFGRNVPMAIALQQIVPADYRYSFEKSVNPSTKISWQGGKPWKQVVADIARNNNMNVDIASNVVSFSRSSPMDVVATSNDSVFGTPMPAPVASASTAAPAVSSPKASIHDDLFDDMPAGNAQPSSRVPLASVSDTSAASTLPPIKPLEGNSAAPAEKSAFFDSLMDNGNPSSGVKDKQIAMADNKPVDILDKVSVASPRPAQTSTMPPAMPKPVESAPIPPAPLPAAPGNAPINIMKQIDNAPVMANDLPAPSVTPATEPPATPVMDNVNVSKAAMAATQEWQGHKGETLRQTLTAWSQQANVSLVWSSEYDYPLQTDVRIQGNYADAIRTLLAGFSKAQPRPIGRLFKNEKVGAQAVLIIETQRLTD